MLFFSALSLRSSRSNSQKFPFAFPPLFLSQGTLERERERSSALSSFPLLEHTLSLFDPRLLKKR